MRDKHPEASRGQQRRDVDEAVNVIRPAVEKNHGWADGRTDFRVADIQDPGVDLFQLAECLRARGLDSFSANGAESCATNRDASHAQEPAAIAVELLTHVLNPSAHQAFTRSAIRRGVLPNEVAGVEVDYTGWADANLLDDGFDHESSSRT